MSQKRLARPSFRKENPPIATQLGWWPGGFECTIFPPKQQNIPLKFKTLHPRQIKWEEFDYY